MTHEELEALTKATTGLAGETSERVDRLQDFCSMNNATINRNFRNVGDDITTLCNRIKATEDCQNAMLFLTLGYFGLKLLHSTGADKKIKDKFFKKKEEAPKEEEEEDEIDEIIDDTL